MCPCLRLIIFLTIFVLVSGYVKRKGKMTTKTFVPVSRMKKFNGTHSRKYNLPVITWVSIDAGDGDSPTTDNTDKIGSKVPTVTAGPTASKAPSVTASPTASKAPSVTASPTADADEAPTSTAGQTEYHYGRRKKIKLSIWKPVEVNKETASTTHYSTVPDEKPEALTTTTTSTTEYSTVTTELSVALDTATTEQDTNGTTDTENDDANMTPDDCIFYRDTQVQFDLNKMADIWQTVYYELPDKIQCFKIYIKKISDAERKIYQKTYGTFEDKLDWDQIFLEIEAFRNNMSRKHFLQGSNEEKGVMSNVLINEENNHHILQEESANQWLVVQKLLLMRDCDSGGYVVFSKVPYVPLQLDLREALNNFGVKFGNGRPACDSDEGARLDESDDDVEK